MTNLVFIPDAVIAEIRTTIDPNFDGTIPHASSIQTATRRLQYQKRSPLTEVVEIIDPLTFVPKMVDGTSHEYVTAYYVRVNGNVVYEVMSSDRLVAPKK